MPRKPRGVGGDHETLCASCNELRGVVRDLNSATLRWRVARHAVVRDGPICAGSRVEVPDAAVIPRRVPQAAGR